MKRPMPSFVLPALARQDPQPQGSYVAPSRQIYSELKSPVNTLNYCFIYGFRVAPVIKKGLTADIFYGRPRRGSGWRIFTPERCAAFDGPRCAQETTNLKPHVH